MATNEATARIRDTALKALKESGSQIAEQLGIAPPDLNFFWKDRDYQQAQELTVLAAFSTRVLDALKTQAEGGDHDESGSTETAKRQSHRPAVSKR